MKLQAALQPGQGKSDMPSIFRISMLKPVFCLLLAAFWSPAEAKASSTAFEIGRNEYIDRRFEVAYKEWFAAGRNGDAEALYFSGLMLDLGKGVRQDRRSAFKYWLEAAEMGEPRAQSRVGYILALEKQPEEYLGTPPYGARSIALTWLLRAAQNGAHTAYEHLAEFHCDADTPDYDPDLAATWSLIGKGKYGQQNVTLVCGPSPGADPARRQLIELRALAVRQAYDLPLRSKTLVDTPFWFDLVQ